MDYMVHARRKRQQTDGQLSTTPHYMRISSKRTTMHTLSVYEERHLVQEEESIGGYRII